MENLFKSDEQWRAIQARNGKGIRRSKRNQKFSSRAIRRENSSQNPVLIPGEHFPVKGDGWTFNG